MVAAGSDEPSSCIGIQRQPEVNPTQILTS
jgi:hypothetical protein